MLYGLNPVYDRHLVDIMRFTSFLTWVRFDQISVSTSETKGEIALMFYSMRDHVK